MKQLDRYRMRDAAIVGAEGRYHDLVAWRAHMRVEVYDGSVSIDDIVRRRAKLLDRVEAADNLLMTAGATAVWNGLVTSGLATPLNSTNAQIAVGNSNASESAGQTDLQASAGSTLNTGDISDATNATPIVLTVPGWSSQPAVGEVVVVAGVNGNTNANGTFEVQAVTSTTLTLKNSAGNAGFSTSAGSTVKLINKYRQLVSGAPSVSTNTVQFAAVFATANANFQWREWGITSGGGATNKQAVAPPLLLNRKAVDLITKTSAVTATATVTLTLS